MREQTNQEGKESMKMVVVDPVFPFTSSEPFNCDVWGD
jgi:hypothetical protein